MPRFGGVVIVLILGISLGLIKISTIALGELALPTPPEVKRVQTPAPVPPPATEQARPPADLFNRLQLAKATLAEANKILGAPRLTPAGSAEYSVGGYAITVVPSRGGDKSALGTSVVLSVTVAIVRPRRPGTDLNPVTLSGYWTTQKCAAPGSCVFELGTKGSLHATKLKELAGVDQRCMPSMRGTDLVIRYSCAGKLENNFVQVDVWADLKYGLDGNLAQKAERAQLMLKIRDIENDPENPERSSAATWRSQFAISGPITNDAVWTLVQDLPISAYAVSDTAALAKQR